MTEEFYVAHLPPEEPYSVSGASVTAQSTGATPDSDQEALDAYILASGPGEPTSYLQAALGDAEAARKAKPPALWLSTLGYLVVIEQISNTIQLRSTPIRREKDDRQCFVATLQEFGDSGLEDKERETLYDVRCALAHWFGLVGSGKQFAYTQHGPMLSPLTDRPIRVNLDEVRQYVERLVDRVRDHHANGNVRILYGVKPQAVVAMRFKVEN